jgi:hypothetical protein
MSKFNIGDIVHTSTEANGWGSDTSVDNKILKILRIVDDGHASGPKYYFERGLVTRECEITHCVAASKGEPAHKFKIGDRVKKHRPRNYSWASGPDASNKDHNTNLEIDDKTVTIVDIWTWPVSSERSTPSLGYIIQDEKGARGSYMEDQLELDSSINPIKFDDLCNDVILMKLEKLKSLYLDNYSNTETVDYSLIESFIESAKNNQPIGKADLKWCNELYKKLKRSIAL